MGFHAKKVGSVGPGDCRLKGCPCTAWKLGRCQESESWRGCENGSVRGMVYVTREESTWGGSG